MSEVDARLQHSRDLWKKLPFDQQIAGGSIVLAVAVWLGAQVLFAGDDGYWTNAFTEGLSILVTVFILERFNRRREENREMSRIMREIKSHDLNGAIAVEELHHRGLLKGENGILKKMRLWTANLQGAVLIQANLEGIELINANLSKADISHANLKHADLYNANLSKAMLMHTDLSQSRLERVNFSNAHILDANLRETILCLANLIEANLSGANLSHADLTQTNLTKANLRGTNLTNIYFGYANLEGANLSRANLTGSSFIKTNLNGVIWKDFTGSAILPDGIEWTEQMDDEYMRRFSDAEHPEYEATWEKIKKIREEMSLDD